MHLRSLHIRNFRRLKKVKIDLENRTTVFVGANNSGKTSATQIFRCFFGASSQPFTFYDFSAACWETFDQIGKEEVLSTAFPRIILDLWFEVEDDDLHRVINILPSLEWDAEPIGVRLEFGPRDSNATRERYRGLKAQQRAESREIPEGNTFKPWPTTMSDYLRKEISREYMVRYYTLEYGAMVEDELPEEYDPVPLGDSVESGASILRSLIRIDFLDAQRFLADADSRGRSQDLSRRLSNFYRRNLEQLPLDSTSSQALAQSEENLNEHLEKVFAPTLGKLNELGYPGFSEPNLLIRSTLSSERVVGQSTAVHYKIPSKTGSSNADLRTLPDRYSGLGFKNLVYMVIELLDFHEQWATEEADRPVLHLMLVEEPEVHLHVQLQQVFIRKIYDVIADSDADLPQIVVTTHSPHIIDEKDQSIVRYFRKIDYPLSDDSSVTDVVNVSRVSEFESDSKFLQRYLKLTHCDLFFADAAILVEGNAERLLLPLMIDKVAKTLSSRYLTVLEVGGNFAHKFAPLISLLGIPMLIVTDLDSVDPTNNRKSCRADLAGAKSSNGTLINWLTRDVADLLSLKQSDKVVPATVGGDVEICVAYQTKRDARIRGEEGQATGRTFEEAFIFENLEWVYGNSELSKLLGISQEAPALSLEGTLTAIHDRVKSDTFKKTDFALGIMTSDGKWAVPGYIADGLTWLRNKLGDEAPVGPYPPQISE